MATVIVISDHEDEAPRFVSDSINLISDSEDDENENIQVSALANQRVLGKRKAVDPQPEAARADDSDDDDCMVMARPEREVREDNASNGGCSSSASAAAAATTHAEEEEDEVVFEGRTGDLALADFPHARENCAVFSFTKDPKAKCENCFCCARILTTRSLSRASPAPAPATAAPAPPRARARAPTRPHNVGHLRSPAS